MSVFRKGLKYARDPLSSMFPDMPADELQELSDDIKLNGQREPIIVKGNKVLDGWHRYQACLTAGVPPWMEEYDPEQDGADTNAFVMSRNLFRRQLSGDQRALLAAKALGYSPTGKAGRKVTGAASLAQVANAAKVSLSTAKRATKGIKPGADKPAPTLESLTKLLAMAEGRVKSIKAQIAELQPIAKTPAKRVLGKRIVR